MAGKYSNKGAVMIVPGSSPSRENNRNELKSGATGKTFFIPVVTTMSDSNSTPFKSGTLNSPVAEVRPAEGGVTPMILSGVK